jgi:hypothetical protein
MREYPLLMHCKEVNDLGPLLTEGCLIGLDSNSDGKLSRMHTFRTWRGKIDGGSA